MDVESKANALWNKIQRADGPLAIFLIKGDDGWAFRTASVNKKTLYERALRAIGSTLVGVYDLRAKPEWIVDDMEYVWKRK